MRQAYDFSPLYRSMIGADRMADLIETAMRTDIDRSYPPYDIEKTADDAYRITLATAGFASEDLEITAQPNLLIVAGRQRAEGERVYMHRGLAHRAFERRFDLADHVVVKSATYADGLLTIDLAREVPEALRPRRVEIGGGQVAALDQPERPRTRRAA
ncbi:Hsp20 family protein [Phenylobacterium sp.]|uniref:Hsp20 family protein n=1 Tax=Phenylobacterium sp. TaxID=1871053 RepID=UPI002D11D48B|nr:Hsp20 family protein [Phenylobacterium sp.]HLZ73592.1 Hsp20 family protein [Phenylobacterium sp.]